MDRRAEDAVIVLVDDDDGFRGALAELLRDDGLSVREFASAGSVPDDGTLDRASIVITDLRMPGEDGLSFARRLRQAHPATPVVIVTAYEEPDLDRAVSALGRVSLLTKPISYDRMRRLIDDACSACG